MKISFPKKLLPSLISQFSSHSSQFTVHISQFSAHSSQFTVLSSLYIMYNVISCRCVRIRRPRVLCP